jgi:hypothetical protein
MEDDIAMLNIPTKIRMATREAMPVTSVKARSGSKTRMQTTATACFTLNKRVGCLLADDLEFDSARRSCSWFKNRVSCRSIGAFSSIQARYAAISGLWAGAKVLLAVLYEAKA